MLRIDLQGRNCIIKADQEDLVEFVKQEAYHMKIRSMQDIEAFKKAIGKCEGEVWLESIYGDRYNLKSVLSQYIAMAELLRDRNGDLELFARLPEDQMILMAFLRTLED